MDNFKGYKGFEEILNNPYIGRSIFYICKIPNQSKMRKKIIAILFSIVFLSIIVTPTIILAFDNSIDFKVLVLTPEEEEKEKEVNNSIELYSQNENKVLSSFYIFENNNYSQYQFINYHKPHLNLISPPPEFC